MLLAPEARGANSPIWVISHWGLAHCELETLQTLLRGSWSKQRLRDSLPQLQRYLVSRDRQKATVSGNRGAILAPPTAWSPAKGGSCRLKSAPMGVTPHPFH